MSADDSHPSKPVITFFDPAQHHEAEAEGIQYAGTATFADGSTAKISVQMTSETLLDLSGTAMLDDTRVGGVRHLFVLRGKGTRSGMFNLHGVAAGGSAAMINGVMGREGSEAAGQFVITSLGKPPASGTFALTRRG